MKLTNKQEVVLDALRLAELGKHSVSSMAVAYSENHGYDMMTPSEAERVLRSLLKKDAVIETGDGHRYRPLSLWHTTCIGRAALSR